jgi:FixJ family two-component response regulator
MMPKLDGLKLAEEMIRLRSNLPIIMVTGFGEAPDEAKAKAIGIREFLYKPVTGQTLAEAARRVLDARGTVRRAAA